MEFKLRPWKNDDGYSLVNYANNYNIARFMTDKFPYPYTMDDAVNFIEMASISVPSNILAIEVDGKAVGGIGIHIQPDIYQKNAEMGYWLGEPFWGRGIITNAITQMVDYGFKHWPINRIFARPFGTNLASQRVLEKAGFLLEGKFEKTLYKNGEYLDELIYATRLKA
jgi:[ribosomal protein S5]-alanine N-acetyltransferase